METVLIDYNFLAIYDRHFIYLFIMEAVHWDCARRSMYDCYMGQALIIYLPTEGLEPPPPAGNGCLGNEIIALCSTSSIVGTGQPEYCLT